VAKRAGQEREAMRFVAYIRAAGFDPMPCDHQSYHSYRACLQRQYGTIRAGMDQESGRQARLAGRRLVRLSTLKGAAGDIVPNELPSVVQSNPMCEVRRSPSTNSKIPATSLSSVTTTLPGNPTKKDLANCRRKLRHVDYLSALFHLIRLGDLGLHAYPCELCDGIHVGHHPDRVKLRDAKEELASIEARIEALAVEHRKLEDRRTLLFALLDQLLEDTPDC
jgi:hypothetical protein